VSGPVLALVTLAGDAPDRGSLEALRLARKLAGATPLFDPENTRIRS